MHENIACNCLALRRASLSLGEIPSDLSKFNAVKETLRIIQQRDASHDAKLLIGDGFIPTRFGGKSAGRYRLAETGEGIVRCSPG